MFPLQQSDDNELVFQIPSDPCQQGHIPQDLIMDYDATTLGTTIHHSREEKSTYKGIRKNNSNENVSDAMKLKKIMHRDMERQRRKGMAALHSSLRSLLPPHYLKGKRSVSDHMHEAAKYIKELQENINELERKRKKLTVMLPNPCGRENGSSNSVSKDCVTVSPCQDGIEILIKAKGNNLALSRVIQELLKQGLDVVTCVSANVNQNSLHKIQSEVGDVQCINLHTLQKKLIDVINIDNLE